MAAEGADERSARDPEVVHGEGGQRGRHLIPCAAAQGESIRIDNNSTCADRAIDIQGPERCDEFTARPRAGDVAVDVDSAAGDEAEFAGSGQAIDDIETIP